MPNVLSPSELSAALAWRYATKKFDTRRLPAATWDALAASLVLAPSSFGLQPWRFLVVENPQLRARLREHSWNQTQVTDASHLVVFLRRAATNEAEINRHIGRIGEVRGVPLEKLEAYRQLMVANVAQGKSPEVQREWAARQVYIALGQFMAAAAAMGVDTCPLEGIDPARYDEILGLAGSGFETVVACAAGFRAADDAYAQAAKVRYPAGEVLRTV
jgi:nitroreductase